MLKIGLTGGIGSGKSTVSRLFSARGVPIIDADVIAHQLVEPGQPALGLIVSTLGQQFVTPENRLDRKKLGDYIFSDPGAKKQLEAILHPIIYNEITNKIAQLHSQYCILCIPLLFETHMAHIVDRILVVDCPEELQVERVKKRENMTAEKIQARIKNQISREIRLSKADDVIDNADKEEGLNEQVDMLHNLYNSLSTL